MKKHEKLAVELVKTDNFKNLLLAKRLLKLYGKEKLDVEKDGREIRIIDSKIYKLFLSKIDPETKVELKKLDENIFAIDYDIYDQVGWWRTKEGFMTKTKRKNSDEVEYLEIYRTKDGYSLIPEDDSNFKVKGNEEVKFAHRYSDLLNEIHRLLTRREEILNGDYKAIDPKDEELLDAIVKFFGYKEEQKSKVYTKQ